MLSNPIVIFSDSDVLVSDIEYVFREKYDFISSESILWIKDYLFNHQAKLLIVDMDLNKADKKETLDYLKELEANEIAMLLLISEKKKLELERTIGDLTLFLSTDWLVKPFSRNTLYQSVNRIFN